MKKGLLIAIIAIVACFALVGCGTVIINNGTENAPKNNEATDQVSEVQQVPSEEQSIEEKNSLDDIELISDDTKMVFKMSDELESVYYYSGDKITGYEAYIKYETPELANVAKASYDADPDEDVESVTVNGNTLVVKYKPSVYEDISLKELKASFEFINALKGE